MHTYTNTRVCVYVANVICNYLCKVDGAMVMIETLNFLFGGKQNDQ